MAKSTFLDSRSTCAEDLQFGGIPHGYTEILLCSKLPMDLNSEVFHKIHGDISQLRLCKLTRSWLQGAKFLNIGRSERSRTYVLLICRLQEHS